jgi:hypothetical protein
LTEHLQTLPASLDRDTVRRYCTGAATSPEAARRDFVTVMAWGYGSVGYGPWRTRRVLNTPHSSDRLFRALTALHRAGPIAAYRQLGTASRLRGLGPAFGTKYLFFCQAVGGPQRALILDRLVCDWLAARTDVALNPVPWSTPTYRRYLDMVHLWATQLDVAPEFVEQSIFIERARELGGQWGA